MSLTPINLLAALILFTMMTVVGLELTLADFRRVIERPRAVLLGTLAQLTLLPAATALLLLAFPLAGNMAAGVVLIAVAPGGGISNVFCYLAGANVALSITLTGLSSLAAAVTFPVLAALGLKWFAGEAVAVDLPVMALIGQMLFLVLLPVCLGMMVRHRWPRLAVRYGGPLRRFTFLAIIGLLVIAMASDTTGLAGQGLDGLLTALIWTVMAMVLGWMVARATGLQPDEAFTLLIEFSVRNVGLAAIVALAVLERPDLAVFFGAYVLVGYPLAGLVSLAYRKRADQRQ
ncbi:MAG: bile acid:sodium symporter [Anderseniella sp.]|jgi:BASS family bile acid:Na+ symporter|nr:bile acid:sodium symporter [Anderseniella sp.]